MSGGVTWSVREDAASEAALARTEVEVLFRAHAQELGRYLVAMVRDRALAEDLLQDTFCDALRAWDKLDGVGNERAKQHLGLQEPDSHAVNGHCIVAHLADGSTVNPLPEGSVPLGHGLARSASALMHP